MYTEDITGLKNKVIISMVRMFKSRFGRSYRIKNIISHEKLSVLTKLQIAGINTYLRKQKLFVRVAVKGNSVWEIWYSELGGES
jgi:hypothetical protein